jgi:hypothetical protein
VDADERRRLALHCAGKPQQNALVESFIGRLRDECLNETLFSSLSQARTVLDAWRVDYNGVRPHSALARHSQWAKIFRSDSSQSGRLLLDESYRCAGLGCASVSQHPVIQMCYLR